jgi:hypothetical protein
MQSFQNISLANPFSKENKTWAVCYLGKEGDENNMITLDKEKLSVIKNGKRNEFDISDMLQASAGHKRLLLPLILGGIISPLSLIAIYENTFSPFLLLAVFFAGLFLLYLGITGSEVLIVYFSKGKEEHVFLRSIPENVSRFLFFLNMFISHDRGSPDGPIFYHQYVLGEDGKIPDFSRVKDGEEAYILLTPEELNKYVSHNSSNSKILKINPSKLSAPVRLKNFEDGTARFTIEAINPESILEGN